MRCGCPRCGEFMVHEESGEHLGCVCPDCLYRCTACLGTDSVITKEEIERMKKGEILPGMLGLDEEEDPGEEAESAPPENPDRYFLD